VKQPPTITDIPDDLSPRDLMERLNRARSKGDLQGWTGSLPFHLNREPVQTSKGLPK
jgi:hypothetical protein